jgi:hypothetical protein
MRYRPTEQDASSSASSCDDSSVVSFSSSLDCTRDAVGGSTAYLGMHDCPSGTVAKLLDITLLIQLADHCLPSPYAMPSTSVLCSGPFISEYGPRRPITRAERRLGLQQDATLDTL